jgi:hypothetical protein
VVADDIGRATAGGRATATEAAGDLGVLEREDGVEPEHAGVVVGPDGEDEDHGDAQGSVERGVATDVAVAVDILEQGRVGSAELGGDGGAELGQARELGSGGVDDLAILDEDLAGDVVLEAGDDGELLVGVDGLAGAVELVVAEAVGVVVATVGIAEAGVAVLRVSTAASGVQAGVVDVVTAGAAVGGEGVGLAVGLPDVDLGAAGTDLADTRVDVRRRRLPALVVALGCVSRLPGKGGSGERYHTLPLMNLRSRAHWASQ